MSAPSLIERVKTGLVGLKMPRALEVLDVTLRGIERGEIGTVEAIDALLTEELTIRENRRVRMAVQMARLSAIKTLAGFDFAFQPSLDRNRILTLGNLFFQLVNARYEKGAMILTSNRGFAEWGDIFDDSVVATALLDRLLHHAVVIQIEGSSYRLREHADLLPETVRFKPHATANPIPPTLKRRGRPPKNGGADHPHG
jgi:DNA replication protein DnaC